MPTAPFEDAEAAWTDAERRRLAGFMRRARALEGPGADRKLEALARTLGSLLQDGFRPVVFCRFIATADYLAAWLPKLLGRSFDGLEVRAVTGEVGDEERRERIDELVGHDRRVLVATDCLSEGINLQEHFDAVVHYDLPWNPNRLEQREGRVDRFGQPRDAGQDRAPLRHQQRGRPGRPRRPAAQGARDPQRARRQRAGAGRGRARGRGGGRQRAPAPAGPGPTDGARLHHARGQPPARRLGSCRGAREGGARVLLAERHPARRGRARARGDRQRARRARDGPALPRRCRAALRRRAAPDRQARRAHADPGRARGQAQGSDRPRLPAPRSPSMPGSIPRPSRSAARIRWSPRWPTRC